MAALARLFLVGFLACAYGQYAEERAPRYIASESKPTVAPPVAILKQINRHNEDGSYTYGYEAADGSFKIETKSPTGEVKGKYGYKDDTGKLRVIEYGANKYGFQPAGEGITVAPPTLVDESTRQEGLRATKSQGGRAPVQQQYDYDYDEPAAPAPRPEPRERPSYRAPPPPPPQPQPRPQPKQQYRPAPPPPQPQYRPAPQSAPTPPKPTFFSGAAPAPVPVQDNFFSPSPQPARQFKQQDFRPAPQFAPKPQIEYQDYEQPQPRFPSVNQFSQQRNSQPFSMLDQLLKEYSLPQGGAAPLHDITFGSY
ncbi:protein cappuccino [Achroia grisella]|uniref:protein cappuccino n=1 Tax=Achroia grisella TaxID=688607 RepID=UPI0027D30F3A|nr:protein cappuccino [Achroia grisella]